jgi:hypothetical protein
VGNVGKHTQSHLAPKGLGEVGVLPKQLSSSPNEIPCCHKQLPLLLPLKSHQERNALKAGFGSQSPRSAQTPEYLTQPLFHAGQGTEQRPFGGLGRWGLLCHANIASSSCCIFTTRTAGGRRLVQGPEQAWNLLSAWLFVSAPGPAPPPPPDKAQPGSSQSRPSRGPSRERGEAPSKAKPGPCGLGGAGRGLSWGGMGEGREARPGTDASYRPAWAGLLGPQLP